MCHTAFSLSQIYQLKVQKKFKVCSNNTDSLLNIKHFYANDCKTELEDAENRCYT